jgi:predicted GNAT superfamily acetyltransferase
MTVQRNGGVVLGAFDGDELVGMVYGFLARQEHGPLYLFSQRMGVLPAYQGQGVGEQLKWAQRAWALDHGLDRIVWTYDPLVPPNAYLNICKLGGIARQYRRDNYGFHAELHGPLSTDRFLLEWELASARVVARLDPNWRPQAEEDRLTQAGPPVNHVSWDGRGFPVCGSPDLTRTGPAIRAVAPADWRRLLDTDADLALDWRAKTRLLFEHYLGQGYAVTAYSRNRGANLACNDYLLEAGQ